MAQDVPDNASVLVIATPRAELLKGEVDKLKRYLERGGNLLWLIDQEPLHGLQPLAEYLGLQLTPGVVVDPTSAELRIAPTIALAASYGVHPITENFAFNTAFPFVRQIATKPENGDWHTTQLVEVAQRGWVETGSLEKDLRFDKDRDVHGPIVVAVTLERKVKDKNQRVVVVGTSQFLSNQYRRSAVQSRPRHQHAQLAGGGREPDHRAAARARGQRAHARAHRARGHRCGLPVVAAGRVLCSPAAMVWWRRRQA